MFKSLSNKNKLTLDTAFYGVFVFVVGLILPAILIFVIHFTGNSEIIEEIAKGLVIFFLVLNFDTIKQKIIAAILFGFLFGLSENIFYFNQIFQFGDLSIFEKRFLLTLPMHIVTTLVILFFSLAGRVHILFGIAFAIILHLFFNFIVL